MVVAKEQMLKAPPSYEKNYKGNLNTDNKSKGHLGIES